METRRAKAGRLVVRSASYNSNLLVTGTLALLMGVGLTSCLPTGSEEAPPAAGSCAQPFVTEVAASSIKGSSHIYLKTEALDFLTDPNTVLSAVELQAVLRGHHHKSSEISLSLNGIKVSRRDGGQSVDALSLRQAAGPADTKFSLHKMFLNGAQPFHHFAAQVKANKGELKLSLQGKNLHIEEAKLVFKGTKYENCAAKPEEPVPVNNDPGDTLITGTVPTEAITSSTTIQIDFSNVQQGNTYFCSLDGGPAAPCQSPKIYSDLTNGLHQFSVFAKTSSGVAEASPAVYAWTVDTIAPSATITNAALLPTLSNANNLSFEFSSNEPGKLLCSLDEAPFEACQSPRTVADLSEGVHTFSVNVMDQAGNLSEVPDVFRWRVDLSAPVTIISAVEPAAAISNSVTKDFHFSANESSLFECSVDNGPYSACQSPLALHDLGEGLHWFEVRGTDLAGNQGPGSSYSWNIDLSAPVLAIDTFSPALGVTQSTSITAEFSVNELATVSCSLDGGPAVTCVSPFQVTGLGEGAHVLTLLATDGAGNSSAEAQLSWVMDFTSPLISFGEVSPTGSHLNAQELSVAVNSSESSRLVAMLNGQPLDQSASPLLLAGLSEGTYSLSVQALDAAGNLSNIIVYEFTVDRTVPELSLAALDSRDPVNLDSRLFNFSANEEVFFECQLDGAGFALCQSPSALSGLADGVHLYEVRATDLSGNASLVVQSSWVIDTQAPELSIMATPAGRAISFALSTVEGGLGFECALDSSSYAPCGANISYENLAAGQHLFQARVYDAAGNLGESVFAFDVHIPVETFITGAAPAQALTNQRTISVNFVADQPNSTFRCSLDGQVFSICNSPVAYSGLADGGHQIRVYAVDQFGIPDASPAVYSWTVDGTAPVNSSPGYLTTRNTITVNWATNEPATSQVRYGLGSTINQATAQTSSYVTSHSVQVVGLSSYTIYSLQVTGRDQAGNTYSGAPQAVRTAR